MHNASRIYNPTQWRRYPVQIPYNTYSNDIAPYLISLFLPSCWFVPVIDLVPSRCTRESLPVEIVIWIAMAFQSKFLLCWTVVEWNLHVSSDIRSEYVKVSYVIEEMDFLFREEEGCCNGMNGSIAPALYISFDIPGGQYFVEESSGLIEMVEVSYITFISP